MSAFGTRGRPQCDLPGGGPEIHGIIPDPIPIGKVADALAALIAGSVLAAGVLRVGGSLDPGRIALVCLRLDPCQVDQEQIANRGGSRAKQLADGRRLHKPFPVDVNCAGMVLAVLWSEPVPVNQIAVGIEAAEECIRQLHGPDVAFKSFPRFDQFRALDLHFLSGCGLVDNAIALGGPASGGIDPLAIGARVDGDGVAGIGQFRSVLDGTERGCG